MRRAKSSLYRRVGNIAKESRVQMFPTVNESAMDSLVYKLAEIYEQRVSGTRQQTGSQNVEGPSAPVEGQSIDDVTPLQREAQPVPLNPDQPRQGLVSSQVLEGIGAWENMLPPDGVFSVHVYPPPSPVRNSNRSLSLRSCRDSNSNPSLSICSGEIPKRRSSSFQSRRFRNFSLSIPSPKNSNWSFDFRSSRSSKRNLRPYISQDSQLSSPRLTEFDSRREIFETTKSSLEQTSPAGQVSTDENFVAGAPTMQLEEHPTKAHENLNDEITDTVATAVQRAEQPGQVYEAQNSLRELQSHARTYLSRGEHAQAGILYSEMSVLLHKHPSRQPKSTATGWIAELHFEVEHQLAMKALRQGELEVAKRAFKRLRETQERLKLPDTVRWSLDHWLSLVYIELGSYDCAIILTRDIPKSIESPMNATMLTYLDQLSEHQGTWLVFHAQALSCLARAHEGKTKEAYEEVEELFALYNKSVDENIKQLRGTNINAGDDDTERNQVEQTLRFMLTVVRVQILAGRQKAAKMLINDKKLIDEKNSEGCARILGKTHPLSIERLILAIQLMLPAADRHCDGKFRELQDAMQHGYTRLHPLTLSLCELQLAISLKQGRLTEAMNATKDLITRINDAHLDKNHFKLLQARRWRVRVLFERGEIKAALSSSEQLINDCRTQGFPSPMLSFALACTVDLVTMQLRLRNYGTAETTLLQLLGTITPEFDKIYLSDMAPGAVVAYFFGLSETGESKPLVDEAFATSYLTALQCLYICYLERNALPAEMLHKVADVLERRTHQSLGPMEDLEVLTLMYNLAVIAREKNDHDKALEHLQKARTGFINSLGHDHPHTLLVDFELRLVKLKLLCPVYEHISGTEMGQKILISGYDQDSAGSVDVSDLIRLQKTVLIRLDNALGGSHVFTIAARVDLANVLEKFVDAQDLENLRLEIMWYLLPYKETTFRETTALPFTASGTKNQPWSQERARVFIDRLQSRVEAVYSYTDGTVQPIDDRFLSAVASVGYNKHTSGCHKEAIIAQQAYVALCMSYNVDSAELAEARLELGYMHQSCADTYPDLAIRDQGYMHAVEIYKDIPQARETNAGPLNNAARSFLGAIYFRQGKFALARDEQQEVYRTLTEPQTDDVYTLLDSIYNLALTEEFLNNKHRAVSLWHEGKDISSRKLGSDDKQTRLFVNKLKDWDVLRTRPSSAAGLQHENQRDSVMAGSPKKNT
jgi:tetratricopeptide (TPR) repeat protein